MPTALDTLRKFIADAPPALRAPDALLGWESGPEKVFVCARCAGRIMARGCQLPSPAVAVWEGDLFPVPACQLHEGPAQ